MFPASLWTFALGCLSVAAINPTRTARQDLTDASTQNEQFVTTSKSGGFSVNGSDFRFIGTNAYWLQTLNSEDDIVKVFANMSASGIKVVRTWAFNDVDTIPENGTWFQLIQNGTTTINNGTNGLQKLDLIVKHAENFGIYLMMVLTNNWNPRPLFDNLAAEITNLTETVESPTKRDVTQGTNNSLPRNTLSNDYGGMDVYVRQFGLTNHDEFFMNETIISTFQNFTTAVVSRYVDSPAVLAWEIANDPRCNSSISASPNCNTNTVTRWISRVSQHIRTIDNNHLITSGNHGFFCDSCNKLFPLEVPPPQTSPVPGQRRRLPPDLASGMLLKQRKEVRKRKRALAKKDTTGGIRIRGKWMSSPTRRQTTAGIGPAPATDLSTGVQGVDSQDIINIPQIGFGTFQLFPDQNAYGIDDPSISQFNNTVEAGITWIQTQAKLAKLFGKPISLTGFGLVTQANAPFFVPFNTSIAPFGSDQANNSTSAVQPFGVSDQDRDDAYQQWLDAGITGGIQGMVQYQWGQSNLTAAANSAIQAAPDVTSAGTSQNDDTAGVSPNDGYTIQGVGEAGTQGVLQTASQQIASDSSG